MSFLRTLGSSLNCKDIAVDLGTANTRVYSRGEGIVLNEPSVLAVNTATGAVIAVGKEAKGMMGRTPTGIAAIRPLKDGVSTDFEFTEKMLRYFIQKIHKHRSLARPQVVVSVPSGTTEVERRAVEEATVQAGAKSVLIIEEPLAAAIGAGLPIHESAGNMVVDIGAGTTEVAVVSLGGIVISQSVRVGGDDMDQSIINHFKKYFQLLIGERTAESLKINIGSALPMGNDRLEDEVTGCDLVSGLPKSVLATEADIRRSVEEPVSRIVHVIKEALDRTPPELSSDITLTGMTLSGGGALLTGIAERIQDATGVQVLLAEDPLLCVAMGDGKCLEGFATMKNILTSSVT